MSTSSDAVTAERLAALELEVGRLAGRLAALERSAASGERKAESDGAAPPTSAAGAAPAAISGVPALVGRTLVVLGGAFAVRSLTESGALSAAVGVALGVVYALLWLWIGDRAARRGETVGGAFHALASALIVYPLLFEATARLGLLRPPVAALLVVAVNAAGLAVAWRRGSVAFAWIHQVASLAVATTLLFRTRAVLPFGSALLALAVGSLVLAYGRGWRGQRWLVAIGVDLTVALLVALRLFGRTPPSWLVDGELLALLVALPAVYLTAFVLRLLVQERRVTGFAIFQTAAVMLLGFEAALAVAAPGGRRALALCALVLAVVLHALLARRAEARVGHGAAVAYFATLATFLAAEGVRILLPAAAPLVWLGGAIALSLLTQRVERPFLQIHAALLVAGALGLSGQLLAAVAALAAPPAAEWPALAGGSLAEIATAAIVTALLFRAAGGERSRSATAARILASAAAAAVAAGALTRWLAGFVGAPGEAANAGHLATLRTGVLAVAAVALAFAARAARRAELVRLAAAVLIAGGVKLLLEDLRRGNATDLLFSLALYGAALIAVPALVRPLREVDARTAQRGASNHSRAS
jgi:hypothetical protein